MTDLDPFEAVVDCIVFGLRPKNDSVVKSLKWFRGNLTQFKVVDSREFLTNPKLELHSSPYNSITSKMEKAGGRLDDLIILNRGVNIGGCFDHFLAESKITNQYFKYLSGTRAVERYHYTWDPHRDCYFIFDQAKEAKLRAKGETLALGNPDRYERSKLFIPESGQYLMAAYVEEKIYSAYGIMVATQNGRKYDLKYACALINSKLFTFYAIEKEILRKGKKATPHVGVKGLESIPCPLVAKESQVPLINLVDRILITKKHDPDAVTSALEHEINQLVYKLYGLTEEEIGVVERRT